MTSIPAYSRLSPDFHAQLSSLDNTQELVEKLVSHLYDDEFDAVCLEIASIKERRIDVVTLFSQSTLEIPLMHHIALCPEAMQAIIREYTADVSILKALLCIPERNSVTALHTISQLEEMHEVWLDLVTALRTEEEWLKEALLTSSEGILATTPLHYLMRFAGPKCLTLLSALAQDWTWLIRAITLVDNTFGNLLHAAALNKSPEMLAGLLSLALSATKEHSWLYKALEQLDWDGKTPFRNAAEKHSSPLACIPKTEGASRLRDLAL